MSAERLVQRPAAPRPVPCVPLPPPAAKVSRSCNLVPACRRRLDSRAPWPPAGMAGDDAREQQREHGVLSRWQAHGFKGALGPSRPFLRASRPRLRWCASGTVWPRAILALPPGAPISGAFRELAARLHDTSCAHRGPPADSHAHAHALLVACVRQAAPYKDKAVEFPGAKDNAVYSSNGTPRQADGGCPPPCPCPLAASSWCAPVPRRRLPLCCAATHSIVTSCSTLLLLPGPWPPHMHQAPSSTRS